MLLPPHPTVRADFPHTAVQQSLHQQAHAGSTVSPQFHQTQIVVQMSEERPA